MLAACLFLLGHCLGALALYANHRYILHGRLGATKYLKWAYRLHAMHHKHAYPGTESDSKRYYVFFSRTPIPVLISLAMLISGTIYFLPALGLGLASAWMYYEFMHRAAHGFLRYTHVGHHHEMHHMHPKYNYAGVYPFLDRVFRTKLKEKRDDT